MYNQHYGFSRSPFSIAPDPAFLYLSHSHTEALAHLTYGFTNGGFVLVTGEVGTGKTTLLRNLISQTPDDVDVAFILNPRLTVKELLESLCDELSVTYDRTVTQSVKLYIDAINQHLLKTHQEGRSTVLIIDEAQNLSPAVLEQIRLLTNLETNEKKLLRIILLGQPELGELLDRQELRQLAQRITARYHLGSLNREDTSAYEAHRLAYAGGSPKIFTTGAVGALHRIAKGTPRLINVIADRALLGGFVEGDHRVTAKIVRRAATEVLGRKSKTPIWILAGIALLGTAGVAWALLSDVRLPADVAQVESDASLTSEAVASAEPKSQTSESTRLGSNRSESKRSESRDLNIEFMPEPTTASPALSAPQPNPSAVVTAPATVERPLNVSTYQTQRYAYEAILSAWRQTGADWNDEIPCNYAASVGLQCLARRGSWQDIEDLDLPVVIELWDTQSDPYYAAVTGMAEANLSLNVGGRSLQTDRYNLRDSWFGAYVVLWPTPPDYKGSIRRGDAGEAVRWVRDRLDQTSEQNLDSVNPLYFDNRLESAVRAFQQRGKLEPDGVVGPLTWIRLYQMEPGGPRLVGS